MPPSHARVFPFPETPRLGFQFGTKPWLGVCPPVLHQFKVMQGILLILLIWCLQQIRAFRLGHSFSPYSTSAPHAPQHAASSGRFGQSKSTDTHWEPYHNMIRRHNTVTKDKFDFLSPKPTHPANSTGPSTLTKAQQAQHMAQARKRSRYIRLGHRTKALTVWLLKHKQKLQMWDLFTNPGLFEHVYTSILQKHIEKTEEAERKRHEKELEIRQELEEEKQLREERRKFKVDEGPPPD